jgi:ribosomal protein S18 acetylase RimI-like enzyme
MRKNLEIRIKTLSKKACRENISKFMKIEKDYIQPWEEGDFMEQEPEKWELSRYATNWAEIVGFLIGSHRKETYYMNRLMIHPAYRRNGIGKELYYNFEKSCRDKKQENNITLRVLLNNRNALNLYKDLGFEILSLDKKTGLYLMKKMLFSANKGNIPNYLRNTY